MTCLAEVIDLCSSSDEDERKSSAARERYHHRAPPPIPKPTAPPSPIPLHRPPPAVTAHSSICSSSSSAASPPPTNQPLPIPARTVHKAKEPAVEWAESLAAPQDGFADEHEYQPSEGESYASSFPEKSDHMEISDSKLYRRSVPSRSETAHVPSRSRSRSSSLEIISFTPIPARKGKEKASVSPQASTFRHHTALPPVHNASRASNPIPRVSRLPDGSRPGFASTLAAGGKRRASPSLPLFRPKVPRTDYNGWADEVVHADIDEFVTPDEDEWGFADEDEDEEDDEDGFFDESFTATARLSHIALPPTLPGTRPTVRQHVSLQVDAAPARRVGRPRRVRTAQLTVNTRHPVATISGTAPSSGRLPISVQVTGASDTGRFTLEADLERGLFLPLDLEPDDIEQRASTYIRKQKSLRPSERSVTGPTWPGEFDFTLRDKYLERKPGASFPGDTKLFQDMIDRRNYEECPTAAPVRLHPPAHGMGPYSPPFELIWTNRVIYPRGVIPQQAPGCDCQGRCDEPRFRKTCACRKRQEAACRWPRPSVPFEDLYRRTGNTDFVFDENGVLRPDRRTENEPIIECNSGCRCSPNCINKTITNGTKVPIDIFHTGHRGWGIRVARAQDGGSLVTAGTPLGIYSGELLMNAAIEQREGMFDGARNYFYQIDFWHIKQDMLADRQARKAQPSYGATLSRSGRPKGAHVGIIPKQEAAAEGDDDYEWTMDALKYGNFTRYCNHNCAPNASGRAVYIDDRLITRPIIVFIATQDIYPGEEICISYFLSWAPSLKDGETLAEYQARAERRRRVAKSDDRCYCGADLCRGVMFTSALQADDLEEFL